MSDVKELLKKRDDLKAKIDKAQRERELAQSRLEEHKNSMLKKYKADSIEAIEDMATSAGEREAELTKELETLIEQATKIVDEGIEQCNSQ